MTLPIFDELSSTSFYRTLGLGAGRREWAFGGSDWVGMEDEVIQLARLAAVPICVANETAHELVGTIAVALGLSSTREPSSMPRYYFDTNDGRSVLIDQVGLELATLEEVRWAALDALPDMARDTLPRHSMNELSVNVRGEDGRLVFAASLVLVIQYA